MVSISITAAGITSASGNQLPVLANKLRQQACLLSPHPYVKTNYGRLSQAIYYAPISQLGDYDLSDRLLWLLLQALEVIREYQPAAIHFILPPSSCARAELINMDVIKQLICQYQEVSKHLSFSNNEQGVCATLSEIIATSSHATMLVVALDSLVNAISYDEFMAQKKIMTVSNTEGYAAGEGLAWFMLTRTVSSQQLTMIGGTNSLIQYISQLPNHQQHCYIHLYQHKPPLLTEWHQLKQRLWLKRHIYDGQPLPKVICLEPVIGDSGAAGIGIAVAVAWHLCRQVGGCFTVCELTPYLGRGVISIS